MVKQSFEAERQQRLDQALARRWPHLDRAAIHRAVRDGAVSVNERTATSAGQMLEAGDRISADLPEEGETSERLPVLLPVRTLHADEALLVVEKPAGVPLLPDAETGIQSVAEVLIEREPALAHVGGAQRAGIVTPMETEVSGLILVGRDEATYRRLKGEVNRGRVERRYIALVEGLLKGEGVIEAPIGNRRHERRRLRVSRTGRAATTRYRALTTYRLLGRTYTLVELRPDSARRHQLRVHLAWYGTPIVGDRLYGSRRQELLDDRLFLHLGQMRFRHPQTGEWITVQSPLPEALDSLLRYLRRPRR